MIRSSSRVAVLSISEKLNSVQKMKVCRLKDIDYLITEIDELPESFKRIKQNEMLN